MKLALSVPSGYHARELLMPLKQLLTDDSDITSIIVITPVADAATELFSNYDQKFEFVPNPTTQADHDQLLRELHPDLTITDTAGLDPHDIPILRAAKANNLRTLTFIASWDNLWKMDRARQQRPLVAADHIVVWNEPMHVHFQQLFPEVPPERIAILGPPRFDFFHHHERIPTRAQLLAYLDFPADDAKLIHFATTSLYPTEYLIKTIHQASQGNLISHPLHLYASVHPGGDITKHQHYTKRYNTHVRYSFGRRDTAPHPAFEYNPTFDDIYMLIALFKNTDVLINHSSTVALESFAADTPVINAKYGQLFDWWRWHRSIVARDFTQHYRDILADNPTTVVKNPRQLITATNTYLDHPEHHRQERAQNLTKMTTTTDGTASQQFLAHIKQIAV